MTQDTADAPRPPGARRRGRPSKSETLADSARDLIVHSAAAEFAREGFDTTSVRAIAREAGVDPALVRHYFADKAELFAEAIAAPMRTNRIVSETLAGTPDQIGANLVRYVVTTLDEPGVKDRIVRMMQTAMAEPFAAELLRAFLLRDVLSQIAIEVAIDDSELRSSLAASQLIGLVMARYAIHLEPLASASIEEVVSAVGPVLQWHLMGNLLPSAHDDEGIAR